MRRLFRWIGFILAGFAFCIVAGVVTFDVLVVRPAALKIEAFIASAAPEERKPPRILVDNIERFYGTILKYYVARDALSAEPSQLEGRHTLNRVITETGVAQLLPLHFSRSEIEIAYLSREYMGPDVYGYARASRKYFGATLCELSFDQVVKLLAIAYAANGYFKHPERFEAIVRNRLSQPRP